MTEDSLKQLADANPIVLDRLAPLSPAALALCEEIVALPYSTGLRAPSARPTRRPRRLVAAIAAATSVAAAAGAYAVASRTHPERVTVACYADDNLNATTAVVLVEKAGAEDACAKLWAEGQFGPPTQAPPLVTCALASGEVGVFPERSPGVCERLQAPTTTVAPGPTPAPDAVPSLRDALVALYLSRPCILPDEAAADARRALDQAGLKDWTVVAGAFTADRPCSGFGFDERNRQVLLTPMPRKP